MPPQHRGPTPARRRVRRCGATGRTVVLRGLAIDFASRPSVAISSVLAPDRTEGAGKATARRGRTRGDR
eukprot:3728943-Pyramimonas_sp.AAC.1